jgi:hypothetical protein
VPIALAGDQGNGLTDHEHYSAQEERCQGQGEEDFYGLSDLVHVVFL